MGSPSPRSTLGSFFFSLGITVAVVVLPCVLALFLRIEELVTSPVLLFLISVALSVGLSSAVSAIWRRRAGTSEILFDDLMIWGWLRHRRFERLLCRAETFVGPNAGSGLSAEQRAKELERLSRALDARDPGTYGHSRRVARYAAKMAERMKVPAEEVARIRTAALLHDVGKIETPREIIDKPGKLTDEEFEVIKAHPGAGARMVAELNDPELTSIVRHHHERIDGGGYPDGTAGDDIPLGARIIAVADTFDALTSTRPYRAALSHERALEILAEESGTQLDAGAVEAFEAQYGGHRPVAVYAAVLGLGRQVGQTLAGIGTGASQVAAVGAAATVLGTVPIKIPPPPPVDPVASNPPTRSVTAPVASTSTTASSHPADSVASDPVHRETGERQPGEQEIGPGPATEGPVDGGESGDGDGGEKAPADPGPDDPGDGSGGPTDTDTGTGGESGGGSDRGGSTVVQEPAEAPSVVVPVVQGVVDSIPAVPEQVPGAGTVNHLLDDVKGLPGKILGKK